MQTTRPKQNVLNTLWHNNPVLVQLLGLCPLLGASNSTVNALGLGLATILILICSNGLVSIFKAQIPHTLRLPIFVLLIAGLTTCVELLMKAYAFDIYLSLGIFLPLIVTNCIILARAENCAVKEKPFVACLDGLLTGTGFAFVLLMLGMLRELLGHGTLFANMHLLFGAIADDWQITIFKDYKSFLVMLLPPGAFIIMGFLIAFKNWVDAILCN